MSRTTTTTVLLPALAAAALALAGCHKSNDQTAAATAPAADTGNAAAAPGTGATTAPAGGWTQMVVKTPEGGYRMGNPDAPVKLIEYGSRSCPHCAHFDEEGVPKLESQYIPTGKVSYEFRDFPIHPMDLAAILLGQCVEPSAFFPMLDQMMKGQQAVFDKLQNPPADLDQRMNGKTPNQQAQIWADYLGYTQFVGQRGVPEAKAKACLADTKAVDALSKQLQDAQAKYNVNATPTFIINGTPATGAYDWATLEPALKAAGA